MLESYEEKIKVTETQLDGLEPNMKATEHMTNVSERLKEVDREAKSVSKRSRKASPPKIFKELTAMFEEVSESAKFRQQSEDARAEKDAAAC